MSQNDSRSNPPSGSGLPQPVAGSEPEPWSVEDFAPIISVLRQKIGITLESHRMGLLQARLRARLQARGFTSFTRFVERVLKVDPTGPGMQLLVDLSTVNHILFSRTSPLHIPGRTTRSSHPRGFRIPDPNLVGWLLVRSGTVQPWDDPERLHSQPVAPKS